MENAQQLALALLQKEMGLDIVEHYTEREIIELLSKRIVYILQKGPDAFFQLMYRLDVAEKKLNMVMHEPDAPEQIAKLVYERQLQKMQSRIDNKSGKETKDPDLEW